MTTETFNQFVPGSIRNRGTLTFDTGRVDDRGRAMGALLTVWEEDVAALPASEGDRYRCAMTDRPVGKYFAIRPHATRAGKTYGPVQPERYFPTAAARDAEMKRYIDALQKRADAQQRARERRAEEAEFHAADRKFYG